MCSAMGTAQQVPSLHSQQVDNLVQWLDRSFSSQHSEGLLVGERELSLSLSLSVFFFFLFPRAKSERLRSFVNTLHYRFSTMTSSSQGPSLDFFCK